MGKRKSRKVAGSDSDLEFDNDMEDLNMADQMENYDDDDDSDDEERDNNDFSDEDEHEDDEDKEEEYENAQNGEEMEELEKEYKELRNEEQDILRNLKRHKDEDVQKGQAVKNQKVLWDKTLEFRFLLQKAFTSCNRLPQEPVRSLYCDSDSGVGEAYTDLIASSKKTLDSILGLQQALLENNPSIAQASEAYTKKDPKQLEGSANGDIDEEWSQISQMQSRMSSFRNKSIDKWQRKTQLTTGAAAIKDKLHAFNQSISEQVTAYMRDPSKMIKGMQQNRLAVAVFGNVPEATDNTKQEEAYVIGDPELLDDSDFYQQLLKEFFETAETSSEMAFYALKRMQTKKRKTVDRRASKSRKIRYDVHEKIVNFMAPRPLDIPPMADKLFSNLFGLKSQKQVSAA